MLKEIQEATNNFNPNNILGQGGFVVHKGCLHDGTIVAVKRLKDFISVGGEDQFHTEVEVTSLVVHRNLIRLTGFCATDNERFLMYPYVPNGTVASKLPGYLTEWAMDKGLGEYAETSSEGVHDEWKCQVGVCGEANLQQPWVAV